MRRGSGRINRRRYELTMDSWYLRVPVMKSDRSEEHSDILHIRYCPTYSFVTLGRPTTSRLEIEQQITYWLNQMPNNQVLHHLHILTVVQVIGYLGKQGHNLCYGSENPFSDDLPLIHYKKSVSRHFIGTSIVHFVFQRLYKTLSNVDPFGKIYLSVSGYNLILGFDDLEHLSGVLTDQYCHIMMDSANQAVTVKEFQRLLGRLYSVILSGVNFQ